MSAPADVKRKVASKKSIMWTSFSVCSPLLSPSLPLLSSLSLSLSLLLNLRARYIKHPSTLTLMYKHLSSHRGVSKPCIYKKQTTTTTQTSSHLNGFTSRHLTLLNEPEKIHLCSLIPGPPSSLFIFSQVRQLIPAQSGGGFFWVFFVDEKIKGSLTWGETLHKEAGRPHVCGLPLCCCPSSPWWVKCHFDLTFFIFSLPSTMSLIYVNDVCTHLAAGISRNVYKGTIGQVSFRLCKDLTV